MGLGGTARKLQKVADVAEKLYAQVGELREKVAELHDRVETTTEQIEHLEAENRRQRALIEALAEGQGIDVAGVLDDVEAELEAEQEGDNEDVADDSTTDAEPAEASAGHDKD